MRLLDVGGSTDRPVSCMLAPRAACAAVMPAWPSAMQSLNQPPLRPPQQAFCALRPVLGAQSASAMLAALHKCLAPGRGRHSDGSSLDTAVECLCSLRALLAGLLAEPAKALLYPQVCGVCYAASAAMVACRQAEPTEAQKRPQAILFLLTGPSCERPTRAWKNALWCSATAASSRICGARCCNAATQHAALPVFLPQLLLACVALLNSSVVRVVELAMHLMLQVGMPALLQGRAGCHYQHCWGAGLGIVLFRRFAAPAFGSGSSRV